MEDDPRDPTLDTGKPELLGIRPSRHLLSLSFALTMLFLLLLFLGGAATAEKNK